MGLICQLKEVKSREFIVTDVHTCIVTDAEETTNQANNKDVSKLQVGWKILREVKGNNWNYITK